MNIKKKRLLLIGLILMVGLLRPQFSAAREVTVTPLINLNGEYSDNIFFSRTDKDDDFIFNISPGIELNYASELFDLNSFGTVRFIRYASENDLDREDYFLNLRGRYRLSERLQFLGRINYRQDFTIDSRTFDLFDTTIVETPIVDPEIERGIERFLSERKRYSGFASLDYKLTELSTLNVGYNYLKTDYDLEENTDFEVNDVNLRYMRQLAGQKDRIGTRLTYNERTSDISDIDTYGMGLIWDHFFTETMSLYTDIGLRYTEENLKNSDEKDDDNWSGTAHLRLRRQGETNVINIGLRQNVQTSSTGTSANVSRLYWNLRQTLSERFFFELDGDFYVTRDDGDSFSDVDTVFFDIIPGLRYLLTENHSVILAYNYTIDHDRSLDDNRDTERNRVWINFEFGFPQKW